MNKHTIMASDEVWDDRTLGADEAFVQAVDEGTEAAIDEAAGTQAISIRMQKSMIDDLKLIASLNSGLGYQTLMKQILQRFIDCEKKRIFRELISEKLQEQEKPRSATKPKATKQSKKVA